MQQHLRHSADPAKRVAQISEQVLTLARESLSENAANVFVREAKAAAFPMVYPYEKSLRTLFCELEHNSQLDEIVRSAIHEMGLAHIAEEEAESSRLESACMKWAEHTTVNVVAGNAPSLDAALAPFLGDRDNVSSTWLAKLREMLGDEELGTYMQDVRTTTKAECAIN